MAETKFHIRQVCHNPTDGAFIVAAFDSALPHLASVGSGDQWGSTPFSERADYRQRMYDSIPLSEASRLNQGSEHGRLFIAEVQVNTHHGLDLQGLSLRTDDDGNRFLSVGAAFVRENWWPGYVKGHNSTKPFFENADGASFYVEFLITDFRTGTARKGAGAALLQSARAYSVSRGAKALYLDCWAGNGGGLIKFYTGQGFVKVADFLVERHDSDGWPGSLVMLQLET